MQAVDGWGAQMNRKSGWALPLNYKKANS